MELTILGCGGSFSSARTQCSGYLLRADGATIWMDAGNGTFSHLQQHVSLDDLDAVVLTHYHPDHTSDIYPFFHEQLFSGRAPVPVYSPLGVRRKLEVMIGTDTRERFGTLLDWREVGPGSIFEVGAARFQAFDAAHSAPNNTLRVTEGDKSLCFSGDTGPNDGLISAARDVDLFLCEATWTEEQVGLMAPIHLTAREAGAAARAAEVGRLMLTHMWPVNDPDIIRAQAMDTFGEALELAIETETTTI